MADLVSKIDELLHKPCYLIDMFPRTVPAKPDKRYFAVEEYFQKNRRELNGKFCRLLLKLYCYYDFWVSAGENSAENPDPGLLTEWICHCFEREWREWDDMQIILPECNAMVTLNSDDLYMILYHPDQQLKELISQLVGAEGLFFYKAPEA